MKAWQSQAQRLPFRWLSWQQIGEHSYHFCAPNPHIIIWAELLLFQERDIDLFITAFSDLIVPKTHPKAPTAFEWIERSGERHS